MRVKEVWVFFFKQKTAYEIKECDWSSDVCSSDLRDLVIKSLRMAVRSMKGFGVKVFKGMILHY